VRVAGRCPRGRDAQMPRDEFDRVTVQLTAGDHPHDLLARRSGAIEGPVDGSATDGEDFHDVGDGVFAGGVHAGELGLLAGRELGLFALKFAFGAGDGHSSAGAEPEQVDFEFREGGQDVEEHLAEGVGGVVDGAAEGELDAAGDEEVADVAGVGHGAGKAVELGHDESVTRPDGGQGLIQAGARAAGAGQSLVEIDSVVRDAERGQGSVPFSPSSPDD
jgi:hypothetical protein